MHKYPLSIVIPTYNSFEKMGETLAVLAITADELGAQVIFVDDCSKDETRTRLEEFAEGREGWLVTGLDENSGSAAGPRNRGIELAEGEYIFFLDSDDVPAPDGLRDALETAKRYDYDIVRSSLYVRAADGTVRVSDNVPGWDKIKDLSSRIRALTKYQSLTCSFLMKRQLLLEHEIRFDGTRRIGEDIKFTADVLSVVKSIGFRSKPVRTYVRTATGAESITQKINSHQFGDFIRSWNDVEHRLSKRGVSFVKEHGFAAVQYALRQYVWFQSEQLSRESFDLFSEFCDRHWQHLQGFNFPPRYRELLNAAYVGDHDGFLKATQLRLLVAGHDLKFLKELMPKFEEHYNVRVDQWSGHTQFDEQQMSASLEWADLIWVEWLLGAAVRYSQSLRSDQRMIVRTHRSEVTADYGLQVDWSKVTFFIAIAPHMLGDFSDRFDIPRSKFWLVPNAIDVDAYRVGTSPERFNRIAMVGVLPKLKGFAEGIRLLAELRRDHPYLELWVYGKRPKDLDWLMRIDSERTYFEECERLIDELELRDAVKYQGWVNTKEALADVSAVISLSEYEGLQVAIAEAYCAGAVGLSLDWRGADQGYPKECVFHDRQDLQNELSRLLANESAHAEMAAAGKQLVREIHDTEAVVWPAIQRVLRASRA